MKPLARTARPLRARPRGSLRLIAGASIAASMAAGGSTPAVAQEADGRARVPLPTAQGFALDRFEPAERGSEWFVADSLDVRGRLRPAVGVVGDLGLRPQVVRSFAGDTTAVVSHQLVAHVGGALIAFDRLRLSLSLPVVVAQSGDSAVVGGERFIAASGAAVGDMRYAADVRVVGVYGSPATLAVGGRFWAATGDRSRFAGDERPRGGPHASIAGDMAPFTYSATLAYTFRRSMTFAGEPIGDELCLAAAGGVRVLRRALLVGVEAFGGTVVAPSGAALAQRATPVAVLLGAHYSAGDWRVGFGVGPGLSHGLGTALLRMVGSVEWAPAFLDRALPRREAAPTAAAPPQDRDGDGVPDFEDACPDDHGIRTGDPKTNGCPVTPAAAPASPPGPQPRAPAPPPDRDHDGIPDPSDACPDAPGTASPDPKQNGCPPTKIVAGQITMRDRIHFKLGSAELERESDPIIEAVAATLQAHPEIEHLRIEGHTDNRGTPSLNKTLSKRRADAVLNALVGRGVARSRLTSVGFGQERPIDANVSEEGRKRNRRVELHIEKK